MSEPRVRVITTFAEGTPLVAKVRFHLSQAWLRLVEFVKKLHPKNWMGLGSATLLSMGAAEGLIVLGGQTFMGQFGAFLCLTFGLVFWFISMYLLYIWLFKWIAGCVRNNA